MRAVDYYFRNRQSGFSIARALRPVTEAVGTVRATRILELPRAGANPRTLLRNLLYAQNVHSGEAIAHITGECHYLVWALPRRRTLITVHDLGGLNDYRGAALCYYRMRGIAPLSSARFVAAISRATRDAILRNSAVKPENLEVIYDPVLPEFSLSPREFDSRRPTVLQVGTAPWKNLSRLIAALNGLPVALRIIGEPGAADLAALKHSGLKWSAASNLSDSEVAEEYRNADLVAFVSLSEGFGLPVAEAQATGRALIASNIPTLLEVGGPGGALYVDPLDIGAIRAGVRRLIASPALRNELIGRGLENVRRFAPATAAERYEELYARMDD